MIQLENTEERMLTVDDVVDVFKVSRATVHKWINSKDLPALKVGMVTRIYAEDLRKFFKKFYTGDKLPQGFPFKEVSESVCN